MQTNRLSTLKAIDIWLRMYTEEERNALKLKSGEIEVTFSQTLIARYGHKFPRYSPDVFTANCMKTVVATKSWIYKIINCTSQDYQTWLKGLMPDDFKQRSQTNFAYWKDQGNYQVGTTGYKKLSKDFSKNRTGSSDFGQEYDKEEAWLREDLDLLNSAQLKPVLNITNNPVAETPEADKQKAIFESKFPERRRRRLNVSVTTPVQPEPPKEGQAPQLPEYLAAAGAISATGTVGSNENEKLVLKTATITNMMKGFTTSDFGVRHKNTTQESDTDGYRYVDTFKISEVLHEFQKFDPVDMMERYLKKFDYLFSERCP